MSPLVSSDVLSPRQLAFLAERLPEPPRARTGRPAYSNRDLLPGILRALRSGCRWRDLDHSGFPSGVMHWRRLRYWHRRTGYHRVRRTPLNFLVQEKRLDRSLISLDGADPESGIRKADRLFSQAPRRRNEAVDAGGS